MSRKRPTKYRAPGQRQPRLPDERMQHLLDLGVVHRQTFSSVMWQLALEQGEDPNDPASILFGGTPSDLHASSAPTPTDTGYVAAAAATRPAYPALTRAAVVPAPVAKGKKKFRVKLGKKARRALAAIAANNRIDTAALATALRQQPAPAVTVVVQEPPKPRFRRITMPDGRVTTFEATDQPIEDEDE